MHIKVYCLSMNLEPNTENRCISNERDYAEKIVLRSVIKAQALF